MLTSLSGIDTETLHFTNDLYQGKQHMVHTAVCLVFPKLKGSIYSLFQKE